MDAPARPGEIISFYSYKGGTGRTMALANVACLLAEAIAEDENVLVVDWDLEAPGLHRFLPPRLETPLMLDLGLDSGPGLIDLFVEIEKVLPSSSATTDEGAEAAVSEVLGQIDVLSAISETAVPKVKILRAGRNDNGQYSSRVGTFNWEDLFRRAPTIYQAVAERLAQTFRYVLIDSRTGVTDISGICTTLLPEKLVVVFTPNRQSLTGVRELIEKATSYRKNSDDLRPLTVFPLPSRIEASLEDLRAKWRFGDRDLGIIGYQPMFEALFKHVYGLPACDLSAYFDEVQIQQTPDYAYGEEIAVRRTSDRFSLANSYRVFVRRLSSGAPPWTHPAIEAPVTRPATATRRAGSEATAAAPPAEKQGSGGTTMPAPAPTQGTQTSEPFRISIGAPAQTRAKSAPRVFLSYASADRVPAERIANLLESRGFHVWRDRSIHPGSDFSHGIAEALDTSDVVVVLWSRASIASKWVLTEAEEGVRRGILLPVLIDDVSPPLGFRQQQAVDLRRDLERGIELLPDAIDRVAHASPVETPAAAYAAARAAERFRRRGLAVAAALVLMATATFGLFYLQDRGSAANPGAPPDLPVRVPNFVGARTDDVVRTAQLLNMTIVMMDGTGNVHDSLKGVVTKQDPPADTEIRPGGTVRVSVEAEIVTVPTLAGSTLDQALDALVRVGLVLGTTETLLVTDAPDGTIVSQSPAPGTGVALGSKVNVSVARRRGASMPPQRQAPRQ